MQKFKFSLVRYMPDLEMAKEVVNIGLIAEITGGLHERHLSSWEKVRVIDPNADVNLIESAVKVIFDAFKKKGNLENEMLRRFQRNVRISDPIEIEFEEGEDALWNFS